MLSGESELEVEAEVLSDGGVGGGGEEGLVALAVVVDGEGDVAAHGVVCSKTGLDGTITHGGFGEACLYVAREGILVAVGEVEAQVQGVREVAVVWCERMRCVDESIMMAR